MGDLFDFPLALLFGAFDTFAIIHGRRAVLIRICLFHSIYRFFSESPFFNTLANIPNHAFNGRKIFPLLASFLLLIFFNKLLHFFQRVTSVLT